MEYREDRGHWYAVEDVTATGQWYWDRVSAENSHGLHNPQKALTSLARAIDLAHPAVLAADRAAVEAAGTN